MKRQLIISLLLSPVLLLMAGGPLKGKPFKTGEELEFKVYYHSWIGNMTAGYATLKVGDELVKMNGTSAYHIKGEGKSRRAFNWFFKVNDRFETWIHPDQMRPLKFLRRTREGNYEKDEDYIFDHKAESAISTRAKTKITANTQDIVSALYFARNLDFKNAKAGQIFPIDLIFDDEVYTSEIIFDGKDTVEVELGSFECYRFKPRVLTGNVFDDEYPMTLWVTADQNKIPILAISEVLVGSVRLELIRYNNLANPVMAGLVIKP